MSEFALGFLGSSDEGGWFVLRGANQTAGLVSCDHELNPALNSMVEERISLNLRGSRQQLRNVVSTLEKLLHTPTDPQLAPLVLRVWSQDRGAYLYSAITQAQLEIEEGQLSSQASGSMRLHVCVTRESFFFGEEEALPIANSSGSGTSPLTVYNHDDTHLGHDNWFTINTSALGLTQPASLRLEIENSSTGNGLSHFWLGGLTCSDEESRPTLNFEAENAQGGTVLLSGLASGGKYCQYRWSGTGWNTLASWTLGAVEVSQLKGLALTPFLRFFSPIPDERLNLRLQIAQSGTVMWQSPTMAVEKNVGYIAFEPIQLPLGGLPLQAYAYPHQLILQARHGNSGEHLLEVDDLLLLPHEPYFRFNALSMLQNGEKMIVDGRSGLSWSLRDGLEMKTHHQLGGALCLVPSNKQHFWIFQTDTGAKAAIGRSVKMRAWFRRHWSLP